MGALSVRIYASLGQAQLLIVTPVCRPSTRNSIPPFHLQNEPMRGGAGQAPSNPNLISTFWWYSCFPPAMSAFPSQPLISCRRDCAMLPLAIVSGVELIPPVAATSLTHLYSPISRVVASKEPLPVSFGAPLCYYFQQWRGCALSSRSPQFSTHVEATNVCEPIPSDTMQTQLVRNYASLI